MRTNKQISILLSLNIAGSVGLLIWWCLFPVVLPIGDANDNFQNLILDANWTALNLTGLVSCLLLCLGLPGIFIAHYKRFKILGFAGLLLASAGLVLFTAIQYYETLIWPAAAEVNPEMLQAKGVLVSGHTLVTGGLLVSGFILGIGYILLGADSLRTKRYPSVPIWFLMIGAVVFGNGILFPVRTIGLLFFSSGIIWISARLRRYLPKHNI